ncbi:hypothetical protein BDV59DRAFT_194889 [Aspergillus ambiguus]|uniref:uncharacterized protein n=1 Tax=Aspergillus ambiguus TaxID=176160 RepID=UPI003CCD3310
MGVFHLWELTLRKLFPKRTTRNRNNSVQTGETFFSFDSYNTAHTARSEHADGFYMYSQDLLEQEARRREALQLRKSDSSQISYSSAHMSIPRPPLPYTVSSPDWDIFSDAVKYLDRAPEEDIIDWVYSVLSVFSRVYAVAKIVASILLHYGIELEESPDSILTHICHAEQIATSDSVVDLVDAVENLYYSLYARLMLEIANVDLCITSEFDLSNLSPKKPKGIVLPEPTHLLKIYLCCREILDAPTVCRDPNLKLISQYQIAYIQRAMDRTTAAGGLFLHDFLGYRASVMSVLANRTSSFHQRWDGEPTYAIPPAELLTTLSEKYLAVVPQTAAAMIDPVLPATEQLPFVPRDSVDPETWERGLIKAHRQATLARLEKRAIGEVRRDDPRRPLQDYVCERQCVCRSTCSCASACTADPERACPCAERVIRVAIARHRQGRGTVDFGTRCSSLAKAIFEGAAAIRRDVDEFEIAVELDGALEVFARELAREREERPAGQREESFSIDPESTSSVRAMVPAATPLTVSFRRSLSTAVPAVSTRFYTVWPSYGITTPVPDRPHRLDGSRSPFCFQTGYALCAKRPSRPFPPPFLSPPSSSFSDPLTTHYQSQDKRLSVRGELVRGLNNGDDAILVADSFLAVNDGVGAWATKPRGHAALWSRLLLHYWALEVERALDATDASDPLDPVEYLQRAYEETTRATTSPSEWYGTTTSVTALLHYTRDAAAGGAPRPRLYVTNLGDCKVLVVRPREETVLFRTHEQWHWFDCPMQLGTNSVDTPRKDAVLSCIDLEEGDVVLAVSDGVLDNLWEHEVLTITLESLQKWDQGRYDRRELEWAPPAALAEERMVFVARELLKAALNVAQDPFAESPYMEKAIEEGLAIEGGKMDDISVVFPLQQLHLPLSSSFLPLDPDTMRAKRSKKYRKLMHQYELAFGFREPYQVLVDSNFLHAVHAFKMDLIPALERTLQGKVKPLLTKCSLAAIMATQPTNPRTNTPFRPAHLPPPTILPLRHCSHNDSDAPIDETSCLLSLLSPSADAKRNKEHYTLATADPPMPKETATTKPSQAAAAGRKRKRGEAEVRAEAALQRARTLRASARAIPGVPIVYVKRSVMILEPMSSLSEGLREGYEMGKFRAGLNDEEKTAGGEKTAKKKAKKVKGPNPLSVKKPKKRAVEKPAAGERRRDEESQAQAQAPSREGEVEDPAPKPKRRRRHHRSKADEGAGGDDDGPPVEAAAEE